MNLFEVVEKANGGKFHRRSEPNLTYRVETCRRNHSGAIFEYEELYFEERHGNSLINKGFGSLTLPRIMADDWEVIDEKVVE